MTITNAVNCACSDTTNNKTLLDGRTFLLSRLGYGAQAFNPPPGMAALCNSLLQGAQEALYRRYDVLRTERFFSWPLTINVRKYELPNNAEQTDPTAPCTKKLDQRKVTWVGVERDGVWSPLLEGIPPEMYSHAATGRPERYEIRQCIELWPAPEATLGNLVIKGRFGLEPFAADTDKTTIDSELVFMLALANAKAHYGQQDANNYVAQLEAMMLNLVAGSHQTRRYVPGGLPRSSYVQPRPTVPFA